MGPAHDPQRLEVESVFETGDDQKAITEGLEIALNEAVVELHELRLLTRDRALTASRRTCWGTGGSKEEDPQQAELDRLLGKQYEEATGGRTGG